MPSTAVAGALARACHPGPTVAVTLLATLLAVSAGAGPALVVAVAAAVLTGQLVIGWSNDLVDRDRDASSGRTDKPLVGGELSVGVLRRAVAAAAGTTVVLSLLLGWVAGGLHLLLVVGSGLAYNVGLKATAVSWLPYALAFGSLPQVAWWAGGSGPVAWAELGMPSAAPWWATLAGALLGVGAHLLNALPDLAEDERQGVRGLPHRLGAGPVRRLAPLLLLAGVVLAVLGPAGGWPLGVPGLLTLVLAVALAVLAWTLPGRAPFVASMGMAVVAAAALVVG
ncbi:UbiA family prenyltransferase [Ornithinimicrobium sufpigmenti]|uniref:UbiA family prenyltransferase n=1 Tax=Ornithinimicrobium sufpigmenti TaxID=2508882 RepID=UPI001035DCE6|nr:MULTISPECIES: UbiA family prenyltransferase [unclassified Ornithinimicrobium]